MSAIREDSKKMSLKNRVIELVLRGKNLFSKPAEEATASTEELAAASKQLKDELKTLEKQTGLVEAYNKQVSALQTLTQEQQSYANQVTQLQQTERESGRLTEAQAKSLKDLQAATKLTEKDIRSVTRSIETKAGALHRAGIETDGLEAKQAELNSKLQQTRNALNTTNTQLAGNIASHRAAAAAADKHGTSVKKADENVGGFTTRVKVATGQILALVGAYAGFDVLIRIGHSFMQASTEMENLTARAKNAYKDLGLAKNAMVEFQKIAVTTPFSLEAVTDAALKLKTFGLDPLDGSLQSLIDQSSAMGVSQENLEGIILAVGQAWAKQKLQGEEILQLVERGVPVWDMLGRILGKTSGEVQKLSEQGRLGRAEIKLLISEMGRVNAGAAAESINNMSGSWSNWNDKIREVYRTLGEQGAWKYLTQQVQLATKWLDEMLQTGQVAEWGKSFNSALQSVGESLKSFTGWIGENKAAIMGLIKAYAGIKIAAFFLDGAKAAAQMAGSIRGTSAETSALKKAWDIASAAVGIGSAVAMGALRGLLAVIGSVTVAMRGMGVAGGLMFGPLVAAVVWALTKLEELREAVSSLWESKSNAKESHKSELEQIKKTGDALKEYSNQVGFAIKTMDDYNSKIADGSIVVDELSGKLMSAADHQELMAERNRKSAESSIAALWGMSAESAKLVGQMQQMSESGRSASEMVDTLFSSLKKNGEFSATGNQIQSVVEALAAMERQGYVTGSVLEKEIKKQLASLSGEELLRFRQASEEAFTTVAGASENTARAINEATGEAFRRLGIDIDIIREKSTEMGKDLSANLQTIALDTNTTSAELSKAAAAAIELAKTSADVGLLENTIKSLGNIGKLTKADIVDLMDKSKEKSRELKSEVGKVSEALERLGVVSIKKLQQNALQASKDYKVLLDQIKLGQEPQNAASDGFLKMASSQIELAQAKGEAIPTWLREQAIVLNVSKQFNELTNQYHQAAAGSDSLALSADDLVQSLQANTDAVDQNTEATERMADACEVSGGMVGQLTAGLAEQRAELESLSPTVAAYYDKLMYGTNIQAAATQAEQELAAARAEQQRQFDNWGGVTITGLDSVRESYYKAATAQATFWQQKVSAERVQKQLSDTSNLTADLINKAEQSARSFNLLDDSSLSGLHSAIDSARQRLEQLRQSADQTLSSLEQRLANLNGDAVAATALQLEQERKKLQQQLDDAQASGDAEAIRKLQQAMSLQKQISQQELSRARQADSERKQQELERKKQADERAANEESAKTVAQIQTPPAVSSASAQPEQQLQPIKVIQVNLSSQTGHAATAYTMPGQEQNLLDMLSAARGSSM